MKEVGNRLGGLAESSSYESALREYLFEVEASPRMTIGCADPEKLASVIHGWLLALSVYKIDDRWANDVLPRQANILREK